MKKLLLVCLSAFAGLFLALMLLGLSLGVRAGGDAPCVSKNGDVNADGNVDLSDAVTTLSYLFLGNPSQLVPLCSGPPVAEVRSDSILGVSLILFELVDGMGEGGLLPNCAGSPTMCCPGGNPLPQCGPLKFELTEAPSVLPSADPTRFFFTLRLKVQTVNDIPVNIPGAGDCGLRIDTTPGIPFVEVRSEMIFRSPTPDDERSVVFSAFVMNNLENDDIALTGGFACVAASFGLGVFNDILLGVVENYFLEQSQKGLCQPWVGCQRP